ncbi:ComF family protein [Naasia sp. SYSU D00057]|uniref:ComF family protein n=1 Tax=Naasia sp. SYSU D00057 TaxID=2817380 RepID=UPI001B313B74|nr:phosphoribosyltransferase family protein [Naasia sp. SYSU D00057]
MLASLRAALADALALVLPVACAGCGAPDRAVCAACERALAGEVVVQRLAGGMRVWSAAAYDGPVARVIAAFKDSGATGAAPVLARALRRALAVAAADLAPVADRRLLLVPVPSAPASTRRRGYLPLAVLARAARLPLARALRHVRAVRDQAGLAAAARAVNLAGAMAADRSVAGREVVLLDDVVTTGATLEEAARAVREAGGRVLGAVTLAATPLQRAPHPSSPAPIPSES